MSTVSAKPLSLTMSFENWIRRTLALAAIMVVAAAYPGKPGVVIAGAAGSHHSLADEGTMSDLGGAVGWLNTSPLSAKSLRGKVVLVNFWTYSCINSLRELPYIQSWAARYKDSGLVVIGVHAPEFGFEKERPNVGNAVRELKIAFPVAIDSNRRIWEAFHNQYWPADYLVDGKGRIRYHHFGEGDYGKSEHAIQTLLTENGATGLSDSPVGISADGIEAPPGGDVQSPETYVGSGRAERFVSRERTDRDSRRTYRLPARLSVNQWGLAGSWAVGEERASLQEAAGKIVFRFRARDLHMVLGPAKSAQPVRFVVKLNGAAPGVDCGVDCAPDGSGKVREPRLYQLIRQKGPIEDRTFEIEFLDPGVLAFSFTFG